MQCVCHNVHTKGPCSFLIIKDVADTMWRTSKLGILKNNIVLVYQQQYFKLQKMLIFTDRPRLSKHHYFPLGADFQIGNTGLCIFLEV